MKPLFLLLLTLGAFAHKNHDHSKMAEESPLEERDLASIQQSYLQGVEPLFRQSCFDCHSNETRYPWYAGLPFAKGLIESDISEAKKHLNLSGGFPFQGHGNPKADLEAIRDAVKEETMPPLRYRALHWSAGLSEKEKAAVEKWVEESLRRLGR